MERDPRYVAFKRAALQLSKEKSIGPHRLISIISETQDVIRDEQESHSRNLIDQSNFIELEAAMRRYNHHLRGEECCYDLSPEEARETIQDFVQNEYRIFQNYEVLTKNAKVA